VGAELSAGLVAYVLWLDCAALNYVDVAYDSGSSSSPSASVSSRLVA
jgi:hypothetical protein